MRRLLVGALAAAAFAVDAAPSEASCVVPPLKWRTYTYAPVLNAKFSAGAALAEPGKIPVCNDVIVDGVAPPPAFHDVPIAQVKGLAPTIAVSSGAHLYVSSSSFPVLESHPLHEVLGVGPGPRIGGSSCQVKGPAVFDQRGFTVNGARIFVEADTNVELRRHGTGFVAPGTVVRVGGRACEKRDGVVWISARRIARA